MINELMEKAFWLSELDENSVLLKTAKAQYPGSACAFRAVANMLPLIENSYVLLLGPEICLYNAKITMSRRSLTEDPHPNNFLLLLLSSQDLVFGVSDKIKMAVKDICSRYKPGVLFVLTTCLQEIIGEDFDAVLEETAQETDVPLIGIHTENFTCDSAEPGLENTMLALFKLMKPQKTEKNSLNIWGLQARQPQCTEIVQLLQAKGISVNTVFPACCSLQELERAPVAELNLVMGQYSLALAKEMQKSFGCKYVYCERPYTPEEIAKMYHKIAEALKIDLTLEIQAEKAKLENRIACLKNDKLAGKSCVIGMFHGVRMGRYFNLAELLIRLGVEIKGMILRDVSIDDGEDIQRLKSTGYNFPIINSGNSLQNEIFLKDLSPNYFIGHGDMEYLARLGIEPKNLMVAFSKTGFATLGHILELLEKSPPGFEVLAYKEQFIQKWERV